MISVNRLVEPANRVVGHDQVVRLRVEQEREHAPRTVAGTREEVLPVELLVGDHAERVVPVARRLLVVDHGHYTNGFGSHVIAEVVQAVPGVKAKKIAFPDVPGPGAAGMMAWLRPDAPKIVDAAVQMMKG